MDKKRLKRALGGAILLAILITGISYNGYVKTHTFTLSGNERVKSEEIQPVSGSVKITSKGCGRNPGPNEVINRRRSRTCIPTKTG